MRQGLVDSAAAPAGGIPIAQPVEVVGNGYYDVVTLTNTLPAYVARDCVGGIQEMAGVARVVNGHVILQAMTLADRDGQSEAYDVYLFQGSPTSSTFTDANPAVLHQNDRILLMPGCPFRIFVGDYIALVGGESQAALRNIGCAGQAAAASTSIYLALVCVDTPDYVTTDALVASFDWLRD